MVIYRFTLADYKKAPGMAQRGKELLVLPQMLNFYGCVVSDVRKLAVKFFDNFQGVPDAVEKIRIAERNVLCAGINLASHVLHNNFATHHAKNTFVYRHDGAVPAKMLASSARFRGTYNAKPFPGNNQVRVFFHAR